MEQSTDSLFQLIRALSKAEKRYFRVFSGLEGAGSKSYLVLFDIMSGMKNYDKEMLKKKIKERNLSTDLSKTRQYLFDALIKSLIFFYSENDSEFKTRLQLMQLLVLNKKELFSLAQKKLKIFERNCARQNRTLLLAETYALMKTNAFNLFLNNYDNDNLHELMKKEESNLQLLMNESKFRSLMMQALTLIKEENRMQHDVVTEEYKKLESNPLLQEAGKAKTLRSKLIYLSLMSIIKFKLKKNEEALSNASEYLRLLEKNKHLLKRNTFYYIVGLRNKLIALMELERHREVKAVLSKLKNVSCQNVNQEAIKFRTYYTFSLLTLMNSGDYESASKLIPDIEKELTSYGGLIDRYSALQMLLLMAEVHFGTKDFDKAVTLTNHILNEPQINDYINLNIVSKTTLLMAHYELGNFRLLPSLARSTLRQLNSNGFENTFESAFVKAFMEKQISEATFNQLLSEVETLIRSGKQPLLFDFRKIKRFLKENAVAEVMVD
ncbi:MAG: hypothetical protein SH857_14600 [Chitinophagales bacterium]|nr:hypothetical protein [Chitinophagales bacterium]